MALSSSACKISVTLEGTAALSAMRRFLFRFYLESMRARVDLVVEHCCWVTTSLESFTKSFVPGCSLSAFDVDFARHSQPCPQEPLPPFGVDNEREVHDQMN